MALFFNQATLSHNGTSTVSNITTGEIIEALTATKTAVVPTYNANSTITYVLSLLNSSQAAISGLTITDTLGSYSFGALTLKPLDYIEGSVKYYINGVLQAAPAATTIPELAFSNITVPAGGNTTIIYDAKINNFAPLSTDSTITNTASISGNDIDAVFVIVESVDKGAKLFIFASYMIVVLPPAGTVIFEKASSGMVVAAGAACNTPFI